MIQENSPYPMLTEPGIRRFMTESDSFYPPNAVEMTIEQQRRFYDALCAHFKKPRPGDIRATDLNISSSDTEIPIRIYRPNPATKLPVMLYLHGGGFVVGSLESHDDICAEIASQAGVNVIAVDYRMAPEHPFPTPFEDCNTVLNALPDLGHQFNLDHERTVVGGDSAGGNLAAALCIDNRDNKRVGGNAVNIVGQVLIYPGLGGDTTRGSYVEHANAPGLSTDDINYYHEIYAGPPDSKHHKNKLASPLLESDFSDLPPAFLVAARFDPLHDDCRDYAEKLQQAGVAANVRDEPLLVHAFLRARHMSDAASASFEAIVRATESFAYKM